MSRRGSGPSAYDRYEANMDPRDYKLFRGSLRWYISIQGELYGARLRGEHQQVKVLEGYHGGHTRRMYEILSKYPAFEAEAGRLYNQLPEQRARRQIENAEMARQYAVYIAEVEAWMAEHTVEKEVDGETVTVLKEDAQHRLPA